MGYIKSGDDGRTTLINGKRVKKYSDTIELSGVLEELNIFFGYVLEALQARQEFASLLKPLLRVQQELFGLGKHISAGNKFVINPHQVTLLEEEIDALSTRLPLLSSQILPSGGEAAIRFHMTWAVCRRAERLVFRIAATNRNATTIGIYLNRLGDWLYLMARTAAWLVNIEETTVASNYCSSG